jgi:hypothetical protein
MNIEIAKNILKEFIIAMNHWEIRCYPKLKSDSSEEAYLQMTKDLNFIFDKFCTKKERKYGRQAALSCGNPPEYSPDEEILKIEELKGNKVVIYTQQQNRTKSQFRYTLHYKKHEWRIDKKEVYDKFDNNWDKYPL